MVELRNGKQADQAGIHQQPVQPHDTHYNFADAKRKDSLACEHGSARDDSQPVSTIDAGDDLPRILEEIGQEEQRLELEQKKRKQQQEGNKQEGNEAHQPIGRLSLPQDQEHWESEQSIPQKRAHSDISLLNFDNDEINKVGEESNEYRGERPSADANKQAGNEQKDGQIMEPQEGELKFFPGTDKLAPAPGTQPSLCQSSKNNDAPVQPPDRRPTPGRIDNPRAVNGEGDVPMFSRGIVEEFPWKTYPNYSNRTYMSMDQHGISHEDEDASKGPLKKKGRYSDPERLKSEE